MASDCLCRLRSEFSPSDKLLETRRDWIPMKFLDIAKQRCSTRGFTDQQVEPEKLALILEAAHVAPTAGNRQPVRLVVVRSQEGLEKLGKATKLYHAPLAILVCADRNVAWTRPQDKKQTCDIDAAILTDHMMLQATELGLGSVWIGAFDPTIVREEFCLPDHIEAVSILALGYPQNALTSPDRHSQTRIPLDQLVFFDKLE